MVFTAAQITAFFEDGAQMGLSNRTRVYLQGEGITHPDNLIEFVKKEAWTRSYKTASAHHRWSMLQ